MSRVVGRRSAWIALVVLGALAGPGGLSPLAGQKVASSDWTLEEARGGFCVWYLVDPAMAPALAEKGTVLAAAGTGSNLPPALAQTIRDEPRFTSWIPAAICVGLYNQVTIDGGKPIRASADQPIAIVSHMIAAQSPRGVGGAGFLLIKLASDNRTVRSQAGDRGIDMDGITVVAGKDRGTPEDRVEFRLENTSILWIGHPSGEPSVGTTRSMSFGYAGARATNWQGTLEATPGQSFVMFGALRVAGKGPLAKALKSSPIRPTGPIEQGGSARLHFQLVGQKGSTGN